MNNQFRLPMNTDALRDRVVYDHSNPVYTLARLAAGHEGLMTDRLSWALKGELPKLIERLAREIEKEWADE